MGSKAATRLERAWRRTTRRHPDVVQNLPFLGYTGRVETARL